MYRYMNILKTKLTSKNRWKHLKFLLFEIEILWGQKQIESIYIF